MGWDGDGEGGREGGMERIRNDRINSILANWETGMMRIMGLMKLVPARRLNWVRVKAALKQNV